MMKRLTILMLFLMSITIVGMAQEKPKPAAALPPAVALPPVDEILDKYVKAIGGKEALEKLNSRIIKGTFEIEAMSMTGPFESYEKAPNKNLSVVTVPNVGNFNTVFDGAKGYSADPMNGIRELSGAELGAAKRDADFYAPINFKKNYKNLEVKSKEKVGASEAFVIEATPDEGSPEKFYFDATSGLLVRQDAERESPQGKVATEIYFDDYKVVDGIKVAHAMRQTNPMFSMTIKLTEVKHNTPIEDSKFNKPTAN